MYSNDYSQFSIYQIILNNYNYSAMYHVSEISIILDKKLGFVKSLA